jgi:hypothetical protein
MYMQNNIVERLNWRQCYYDLGSILRSKLADVYVYGCADNAKGDTIETNCEQYLTKSIVNDLHRHWQLDIYELCGIIMYNERLNK